MGPAHVTTRSLHSTMGTDIAPSVFPYGPEWSGKVAPYSPSYNTPHSGGSAPPPMFPGTLRRSTNFPVQPEPVPKDPFGSRINVTFELRTHSARNTPSDKMVTVSVGNHMPLGKIIDAAMYKAFESGTLTGHSHRIISVCGPSGKLLKIGSGLTLYDQSPPVPAGSTMVLVFQD